MPTTFELSIYGGAAEARYRRARPDVDALPWGSIDTSGHTEQEVILARREWTDAALHEYASAAHFSVCTHALVRACVPLDLSAMIARFPHDELVHAELCARIAGELGGGTPIEYEPHQFFPLPNASDAKKSPLLAAAEHVVHQMCIRETWSLAVIRALKKNRQPLYKALWSQIAEDEAAHAGFGWLFLEWAELTDADRTHLGKLAQGSLKRLRAQIESGEKRPLERFSPLGIVNSIGRDQYMKAARRVIEARIIPTLARYGIICS